MGFGEPSCQADPLWAVPSVGRGHLLVCWSCLGLEALVVRVPATFWGRVVPLCLQIILRPWLGCLHRQPCESVSLCAYVRVCACVHMCCTQAGAPGKLVQRVWHLPASLPSPTSLGPGSLSGLSSSSLVLVFSYSSKAELQAQAD